VSRDTAVGDELSPPPREVQFPDQVNAVKLQILYQRALSLPFTKTYMLVDPCKTHAAGPVPAAMGEPTRSGVAWTLGVLLCDVLTFVLAGLEVVAFALLGVALTLVVLTTAQSETSMMIAKAILNTLRLCFITYLS